MTEFVLFCLPTIIYLVVQSRGKGLTPAEATFRAGISWGAPSAYGWALLLLFPLMLASWLAIAVVPPASLEMPGVSVAQLTSLGAVIRVVFRAVGEEVLFRGLIGGSLMKRLGFGWGNLLQALLFLIPHLSLMLIDIRFWPVIPVQLAVGWLLGWLRHKTGTFVPGAAIHALANIAAGAITA